MDGGFLDGHGNYGGLLRDDLENKQWGFTGNFPASSPLNTELAALKVGLTAVVERNLLRVLIETDSTQVVHLFPRQPNDDNPLKDDILGCQALLAKLWNSPMLYTSCVCNRAAHAIAPLGVNYVQPCCVWFVDLPTSVTQFVKFDNVI